MGTPVLQPTFTGGELSPSLYARVDLARYGTSVRTAKNFIVRPYGGLVNRAGLGFVGEVKDSADRVRLLPFEYSSEIAYVIELGDQYARFIYRGAYVVDGLGDPVEVATPWTLAEIGDVAYTQSADVMYLVHPDHQPRELRRLTSSSFEIRTFSNRNGPFAPINTDEAVVVAASADTGVVTITSNADIFTAAMVGTLVYIEEKDLRNLRPWEPAWRNVGLGTLCRSDSKTYRCSSIPGGSVTWYQTGSIRPIHDAGRAWDGPKDTRTTGTDSYAVGVEWEYMHSGFGIVLITGFTNAKTVTGVVTSRLPETVVGGVGSPGSTWNLVGNGVTKTFTITGATSSSTLDYTVTINGVPVQADPYYPGGGDRCVDVESILPGGVRAGDVKVGDELELYDPWIAQPAVGIVTHSETKPAHRWRIVTAGGASLVCSDSAPIPVESRGYKTPDDLLGEYVPVRSGDGVLWQEVIDVIDTGEGFVQHITVGDRCFWAGADGAGFILHHNAKNQWELA